MRTLSGIAARYKAQRQILITVQVCCCGIAAICIINFARFPSCVRHGGVKVTWSSESRRIEVPEHGQASVSPFSLRRAKSSKIISSSPSASLETSKKISNVPQGHVSLSFSRKLEPNIHLEISKRLTRVSIQFSRETRSLFSSILWKMASRWWSALFCISARLGLAIPFPLHGLFRYFQT